MTFTVPLRAEDWIFERPRRVQRARTPGWRMPEGAIYVGRPTAWGNQFRIGDPFPRKDRQRDPSLNGLHMNQYDVVEIHRQWLQRHVRIERDIDLSPLRGRDLACWCRLCERHQDGRRVGDRCRDCEPCHADALLEEANRPAVIPGRARCST